MKKKIIASLVSVSLILGIIYYFVSNNRDTDETLDYAGIAERGIVRIVTNYDPIGYFVLSDTLVSGYNYEFLETLESYADLKFHITLENSLEKSFEGLETGKYDILARNIPINSELRDDYSFTVPTVFNKLVLVQRAQKYNYDIAPLRSHLDLARKTIHLPKGSPSVLRLKNLSYEIGDSIFIVEDDVYEAHQLALAVASGRIDFTILDRKTAQKLSEANPELDVKTDIGFTHLEAWAVRDTSPVLLDSLNSWITRFKKTRKYSIMQRKYYGSTRK